MTVGEVLPQTQASDGRGVLLREACCSFTHQRHLFHVGSAISTGSKVKADADFGQHWQAVIEIFRGKTRNVAADRPTLNPLSCMIVHRRSLSGGLVSPLSLPVLTFLTRAGLSLNFDLIRGLFRLRPSPAPAPGAGGHRDWFP